MQQTLRVVLALSIRQQDESFFCDVCCVFFPVSPIFSISPSIVLWYHLDNRKPCHQRFLNPRKCMLSSLISHYILSMFLNQCHRLKIRIMKHMKANLAFSAIPFSVSGNLLKNTPGGFGSSLQFVLWRQRKVHMGGTQQPVSIFCSLICKCVLHFLRHDNWTQNRNGKKYDY